MSVNPLLRNKRFIPEEIRNFYKIVYTSKFSIFLEYENLNDFSLFHFEQLCIRFLTMDDQEISAVKIRYIVRIVWVSIFQKYSKFWSISEEDNFIEHKHLSSKEWTTMKPHGKKKLSKTSMYSYIILFVCIFQSKANWV